MGAARGHRRGSFSGLRRFSGAERQRRLRPERSFLRALAGFASGFGAACFGFGSRFGLCLSFFGAGFFLFRQP